MSDWRKSVRDSLARRLTDIQPHLPTAIALLAVVIGVGAFLITSSAHSRDDANGLSNYFIGCITATAGILAVYGVFAFVPALERSSYMNTWAVLLSLLGLAAAICGVLSSLPLGVYRYAVGAAAIGVSDGVGTLAAVFIERVRSR